MEFAWGYLALVDNTLSGIYVDTAEATSRKIPQYLLPVNVDETKLPVFGRMNDHYFDATAFVSFLPTGGKYSRDTNNVGFKVVAKIHLEYGMVIPGLCGITAELPNEDIVDGLNNFSVFHASRKKISQTIMLGGLSFVNSCCVPNAQYHHSGQKGLVGIKVKKARGIFPGDEITVLYSSDYFGDDNENCECPFKECHGPDADPCFDQRTRSQNKSRLTVDKEVSGTAPQAKRTKISKSMDVLSLAVDFHGPSGSDQSVSRSTNETQDESLLAVASTSTVTNLSDWCFDELPGLNIVVHEGHTTAQLEPQDQTEASYVPNPVSADEYFVPSQDSADDFESCSSSYSPQRVADNVLLSVQESTHNVPVCSKALSLPSSSVSIVCPEAQNVWSCPHCSAILQKSSISSHLFSFHLDHNGLCVCPFCVSFFSTLRSHSKHVRSHLAAGSAYSLPAPTSTALECSVGSNVTRVVETAVEPTLSPPTQVVLMSSCPICNLRIAVDKMTTHLTESHLSLPCCFCPQVFGSSSGLRRHLKKHTTSVTNSAVIVSPNTIFPRIAADDVSATDVPADSEVLVATSSINEQLPLKTKCADTVLKLASDTSLPLSKCFKACDLFTEVLVSISERLERVAEDLPDNESLNSVIAELKDPFYQVSDYGRFFSYMERSKHFTSVQEIVLGHRWTTSQNSDGAILRASFSKNAYFLSIYSTLVNVVLVHDSIWEAIWKYNDLLDYCNSEDIFLDYQNGSSYRSSQIHCCELNLETQNDGRLTTLCIQLYYDDFETVNPIGSRSRIHKVGAFYWVLKNLPPCYNSNLKFIHLAALARTDDIKKFGFKSILTVISNDLKRFEKGCTITTNSGRQYHCVGALLHVTGDNLGVHGVLNLVENFSKAHYPCEMCTTKSCDFGNSTVEIKRKLRTPELYQTILRELDTFNVDSRLGVKGPCALSTQFYDPGMNFAVDIQHDILEGIGPFIIKLTLHQLIFKDKLFSVTVLNERLRDFSYGVDSRNKPVPIDARRLRDPKERTLKQKSANTYCLLRYLGIILGDLVSDEHHTWLFFLSFVELVDILFSPQFHRGDIDGLKYRVQSFLDTYKTEFPHEKLFFKLHHLIHYPTVIRMNGPLIRMMAMRYEAQHQMFKRLTHNLGNFKNVCKSLVQRYQVAQAVHWSDPQLSIRAECGPGGHVEEQTLPTHVILAMQSNGISCDGTFECKQVRICGTHYKRGMCLFLSVDFDTATDVCIPLFGRIIRIFVSQARKNVIFVLHLMDTLGYNYHQHCYDVTDSSIERSCLFKELYDFHPLSLSLCFARDCALFHVCLRQRIVENNIYALL